MKITPEQAREALDAWICRPGMTQEQATILITESFWALKERPNIDVQRVTDEGGAVDQRALGVNRVAQAVINAAYLVACADGECEAS
ncbi:probable phage regulatory protein [Escherichia coli O111:H- str. 11128]|nr:probable phage regulatory protein [Escherichia coli O111:H- str. 11128]